MAKIISIDALIDRVKLAYPECFETHPTRIETYLRKEWERQRYNAIYRMFETWRALDWSSFVTVQSITDKVIWLVDNSGNTPEEIVNTLIPEFRKLKVWIESEPARQQLKEDFMKTFPESF